MRSEWSRLLREQASESGVWMQYEYELFLRELGARVKKLRSERGYAHRQMIAQFGFHLNQLQRIESGKPVSVQTLLKLCATFDLKLEELVLDLGIPKQQEDVD